MWMNLSPYPNLCKTEKIKSTPRILQKDFIQLIWLVDYDTNSRKSMYNKVVFLIASDCCSPIIVINVFLHLILKAWVRYFFFFFFFKFLFLHQMIALQKLWQVFFISSKKLSSFSRNSDICNFPLPFNTFQIQKDK